MTKLISSCCWNKISSSKPEGGTSLYINFEIKIFSITRCYRSSHVFIVSYRATPVAFNSAGSVSLRHRPSKSWYRQSKSQQLQRRLGLSKLVSKQFLLTSPTVLGLFTTRWFCAGLCATRLKERSQFSFSCIDWPRNVQPNPAPRFSWNRLLAQNVCWKPKVKYRRSHFAYRTVGLTGWMQPSTLEEARTLAVSLPSLAAVRRQR